MARRLCVACRWHLAVSTPQIATDTLIDLWSLRWPALQVSDDGLDIAATCTIAELYARAFLASFKIWNAATVGGNICMSLPAGPMVTLATALEGRYSLWPRDAVPREVAAIDFVTGNCSRASCSVAFIFP